MPNLLNIELSTMTEKGRSEELGGLSLGMKKLNFAKCLFSKQTTKVERGKKISQWKYTYAYFDVIVILV